MSWREKYRVELFETGAGAAFFVLCGMMGWTIGILFGSGVVW